MTISRGKVIVRDDIEPTRWMGETGRFILRSEDTRGLYTFMEVTTPPGGGPPLHTHDLVDEAFYVTSGVYDLRLGDETVRAGAGTLVYGPRGVPHAFENVNGDFSRMLVIATPGGVEKFFEELGSLTASGPPEWDRMSDLATRHGLSGFTRPAEAGAPGGRGGPGGPVVDGPAGVTR